MDNEKIITDKAQIQEESSPEDKEAEELLNSERREVGREKLDLSSTRRVLYKLLKGGSITAQDKLIDVLRVVEEEYAKIEDI